MHETIYNLIIVVDYGLTGYRPSWKKNQVDLFFMMQVLSKMLNLVLVIERHHELGVDLQLASRPLHGGLKHFQYHFRSQEIMMLKQIM